MKQPTIANLANGVRFNFQEYQLTITTQRVRSHGDGIIGELDIETTAPGYPGNLYFGKFNFLSFETRQRLAKGLAERYKEPPWMDVLETMARQTVNALRRGDRMAEVSSAVEVPDVQFDVYPFLQAGQPTTLFGDGATGKSYIALVLACMVRLPWHDNPLGLTVYGDEPAEVVWLDYETTEEDFHRRLNRVAQGMNLGEVTITYRQCSQVLADEIDELSLPVNMRNPRLVVIDSIGAACAGDLHGSEAPTRFFNAIRRLMGAKLLIFHINKEKELYGNRFFWNFSRHAWEVKKQQAEDDEIVSVGLYHRKANETKLFEPRAFNLIFNEGMTMIERANMADIPELAKGLSLTRQLIEALRYGKRDVKDLAAELEEGEDKIRARLNDNRNKKLFKHFEDGWGLLE